MKETNTVTSFGVYKAARVLANVVHACIKAENSPYLRSVEDLRGELANPYYFSTESGLFMRSQYNMPVSIFTPWGEWVIIGEFYEGVDGEFVRKNLIKNIESRVSMTLHAEWKNDQGTEIGHIYAIHEIAGVILPEAKGCFHRSCFSPEFIKEAEETWRRYTAQYFEMPQE